MHSGCRGPVQEAEHLHPRGFPWRAEINAFARATWHMRLDVAAGSTACFALYWWCVGLREESPGEVKVNSLFSMLT